MSVKTERRAGLNYQERAVSLSSHPGRWARVRVIFALEHASVEFENYWQSARVTMTHAELAAVRDAINAVLAEGWT